MLRMPQDAGSSGAGGSASVLWCYGSAAPIKSLDQVLANLAMRVLKAT